MKNLLFIIAFMLIGTLGFAQEGGSCSCKGSSSCKVSCPSGKTPECRSTLFGGCKCVCVDDGPIDLTPAFAQDLEFELEDILELKEIIDKSGNRKLIAELNNVIEFYQKNINDKNLDDDFQSKIEEQRLIAINIYQKLNKYDQNKLVDCES